MEVYRNFTIIRVQRLGWTWKDETFVKAAT
jgi:hypothetical protein